MSTRFQPQLDLEYAPRWVSDDVALFQRSVRRFVEEELLPHEEAWSQAGLTDRRVWQRAGELGILCASIPEAYGGGGGTPAHDAVVALELARAAVTSLGNNVHSGILAHYILAYGTEQQKQQWLPKMVTGELVGAIAMSEPSAGTDLKGIRTRADKTANGYVVNGSKIFITNGYHANLICLVVRTDVSAGSKGVSLLMIETDKVEGFRRGNPLAKIGMKTSDTAELFFDDMVVPAANLLGGEEGKGFTQLMQQLPVERMLIAVGAVACMNRAIEHTVNYTRERKLFGGSLADLQNTRFKLAQCKAEAITTSLFVDDCMERLLKGELDPATAAMAKWWASEVNGRIVDECLQLHGGYGYILDYPIARMFANARAMRIFGGTNEIMKELVARAMF